VQPCQHYDAPTEAMGRRFVCILTEELKGVCSRKWNSEKSIVFQAVILQCSQEVKNAGAVKCHLSNWMDAWQVGKYGMLKQDMERTALAKFAQPAKMCARFVLQGKIRAAVQWLME
jgi:hypothetical protein